MLTFEKWLEGKSNIQFLGHGKWAGSAWVKFFIDGKTYEYMVDPVFTEPSTGIGRKFHTFTKYAPGKALNMAKKYGELSQS